MIPEKIILMSGKILIILYEGDGNNTNGQPLSKIFQVSYF